MLVPRVPTGVLLFCLLLTPSAPAADPRGVVPQPAAVGLLDVVAPAYRETVAQVVRQPTLAAKAADDEFTAHVKIYEWLLEHPDRAALAWRRMKVPCVEITALGDGRFHWSDPNGSELTWRTVGRFADGLVWYATGKVKPGTLLPMVPVKAVAVLRVPRQKVDEKAATFQPVIQVYLQTDSRAANAVLRMIGPAAPRMAEDGAEQLLLFFSGPARYLYKHPDEVPTLLAPKGN
jgi:hypothetical protein